MASLDDEIARKVAEAMASGELARAKGFGKPLEDDERWAQTPEALRLPFKILKDAGYLPQEVELLKERARLRQLINGADADEDQQRLQAKLRKIEQVIALRLESIRRTR